MEDRTLMSAVVQSGTSGADTYFAWEAEKGYDGLTAWNVVASPAADGTNTPSGGAAIQATSGNTSGVPNGTAQYRMQITTGGAYKLYVRAKHSGGGDNSILVPPTGSTEGGLSGATQNFDDTTTAANNNLYTWQQFQGGTTTPIVYNLSPSNTTLYIGTNETGYFLDRVVLSTNAGLTNAQLDALANTPLVFDTAPAAPVVTPGKDVNGAKLNFSSPDASTYSVARSNTAGGPYTPIAGAQNITATSYVDTNTVVGTTYYYQVTATNNIGSSTSNEFAGQRAAFATGGTGWSTAYQDTNARADLAGPPEYRDITPTIAFTGNDGVRPPTTPLTYNNGNGSTFSITYEGTVTAQFTDVYHFFPATDDGMRLTVDGIVLFDNFDAGQGKTERNITVKDAADNANNAGNPVTWTAGSTHTVKMEFQQGGGGWDADLRWGGQFQPKELVPTAQVKPLLPTAPVITPSPTNQAVRLDWNQTDAASYRIEQSTNGGASFVPLSPAVNITATTQTATYTRTISGLTNGTPYIFRVVAINATGETPSAPVTVTPQPTAPAVVTNVTTTTGTPITGTGGYTPQGAAAVPVNVSFDRIPFADRYRVFRAARDGGGNLGAYAEITPTGATGGVADPGSGTRVTFIDTTAQIGISYSYQVSAQNTAGTGPTSTAVNLDLTKGAQERVFNNQWWNSTTQNTNGHTSIGTPTTSGFVGNINWDRNDTTPPPNGTLATNFSTVFTGKLLAPETGTYKILGYSDDDSYVYVNGVLVSADPGGHGIPANTAAGQTDIPTQATVSLTAGQTYNFQAFQSQGGGGHGLILRWLLPSDTTPETLTDIPQANLVPFTGLPTAPTTPVVNGTPTENSISLTFTDNANNELRYLLQRADSAAGPFTTVRTIGFDAATPTGGTVTFNDSGLQPNTTYFYRVAAENYEGVGTSPVSAGIATTAATAVAGANLHYYDDQWWGSTTRNTNGYRSPGAGVEGVVNTANVMSGVIDFHSDSQDTPPPGAPSGDDGLNYAVVISGKVKTNPAQPSNTTNAPETYRFISQSDDDGYIVVNGKLVASYPGGHGDNTDGLQTFTIDLLPNTAYNFQYYMSEGGGGHGFHMRWIAPGDTTDYSQGVPANLPAFYRNAPLVPAANYTSNLEDTPTAPAAPAGSAFSNVSGDSITVGFVDKANSETKYVLQRATSAAFTDAVTIDVPMVLVPNADVDGEPGGAGSTGTAATFTDTGLAAGTTYHYRIRAVNYDGQSAYVNLGSQATTSIGTPTALVANPRLSGQAVVKFNNVTPVGASTELQYSTDANFASGVTTQTLPSTAGAQQTTLTGLTPDTLYYVRVRAVGAAGQGNSPYVTTSVFVNSTVPASSTPLIDRSAGFGAPGAPATGQQINGSAAILPTGTLRLTPQANNQRGSLYTTDTFDVSNFIASFDFQFNQNPVADGFAFVLQRQAPTALGGGGGGLGVSGVNNSVAVIFDFYDNVQQTGLVINGADPQAGQVAITGGIDFNSGNKYHVSLSYTGGVLTQTVVDTTNTTRTFTTTYNVDIPTTIGGSTAYVGFAGATGGASADQDVSGFVLAPNATGNVLPAYVTASAGANYTYSNGALVVSSGTLTFTGDGQQDNMSVTANGNTAAVVFNATQHLQSLTLTAGATATMSPANPTRAAGTQRALVVGTLSIDGSATGTGIVSTLDLGSNDLVVRNANAAAAAATAARVNTLIRAGYAGTAWNGKGIKSSAAAADPNFVTALGLMLNNGADASVKTSFSGQTVGATDVLVKFTYYGDADLNGVTNAVDYGNIDFNQGSSGFWSAGDYDYNGLVNGVDYGNIDFAFLRGTGGANGSPL